jgi:colanic acid biosynthesis glycosyl transferase WcaI
MLTQWYDPEPGPAAIPGVIARELVARGHEVRVLTGFPNYPTGRVHDGYRQSVRSRRRQDGVDVIRVPLHPSHDRRRLGRVANYLTFALSAATLGAGALSGVDGVWVYNSPATVSLPALIAGRGGRVPIFLQVQDLWPESLVESGMMPGGIPGRVISRAVEGVVRTMEERSAVIGVSSPGARRVIADRHPGIPASAIIDAPNPADETLFRPRRRARVPGPFTVMYAGALGEVQGLDAVVDAAEVLRDDPDLRFVLVGDGIARERLRRDIHRRGLSNIELADRVEPSRMRDRMLEADVHLVTLADRPFLRTTTPSKISSLLASEVPIIGALAGDGATLITRSGAGVVVPPADGAALAAAAVRMRGADLPAMAAWGRSYYDRHLSAAAAAARIVEQFSGRPGPIRHAMSVAGKGASTR